MEPQFREVDTKNPTAVCQEVQAIYVDLFPEANLEPIANAFHWLIDAFAGRFGGFQAIDARYHDLEHTLQGTLCFARLLHAYQRVHSEPVLRPKLFQLGVIAILLHDTGYLKESGDSEGTGAKYTLVHVNRSAQFAAALLKEKGFSPDETRAVQNMIRCTGLNADLASIPFQDEWERTLGFALGTADLLGQMAAPDYIRKLEDLYEELDEANRYTGRTAGAGVFADAEDLRQQTPMFWERYVLPKINNEFRGLYRFLSVPFPDGRNEYMEKAQANIRRLNELKAAAA